MEAHPDYSVCWHRTKHWLAEKDKWSDKDIVYDYIRRFGKARATSEFYDSIVSGHADEIRIMKVFVNGEPKKDGDGQSRYLMGFADAVVNAATGGRTAGSIQKAIDMGILDNLISEYKGGTGCRCDGRGAGR